MIPVLFSESETAFSSQGIGKLTDCISYDADEVLNGLYELSLIYPEDGQHAAEIKERRFILAKPNETSSPQPFRIYSIQLDALSHQIVVKAQHRSYDLIGIPVRPFSATGIVPALTGLVSNSMITNPFTFWTDISNTTSGFAVTAPASVRALLGGVRGSILDTFGGEFEWDDLTVKVHARRGADNGVVIKYGKNLQNLNNERTNESFYTGCVAYYEDDDVTVTGDIQLIDDASDYPTPKIFILDASDQFDSDEVPTVSQLNDIAAAYIINNNLGLPFKDTLTVNFVALWQTLEYADIAPLERVSLGDTVHVKYKDFDVAMRVIETHYDGIAGRYTEIVLGAKKASLKDTITDPISAEINTEISGAVSMLSDAIVRSSQMITGGFGGHIEYTFAPDGTPEELLILDETTKEASVNVLRLNLGGIGFSTTGYAGPYRNAWTIDGHLNADFIDTGELNGNLLRAASVLTSALEVSAYDAVTGSIENISYDGDGMHIARKDPDGNIISAYQSLFTELGMRVINSQDVATLIAEGDTVQALNLTAEVFFRISTSVTEPGTQTIHTVSDRLQGFWSSIHNAPMVAAFWEEV